MANRSKRKRFRLQLSTMKKSLMMTEVRPVQLYAKECSKLIIEVLKKGPQSKDTKQPWKSGDVEEPGNAFTKVCFSNRSFGLGAAKLGRPEDEALEVMSIFSAALEGCTLRSLNLSDQCHGERKVLGIWCSSEVTKSVRRTLFNE
ncbi:hypothetical protein MLD38_016896 [Melastoma candidum]|uniref:Uncharacterized protein n=1 Tax=Melastoma candidum TaxID=119954 RepID=A0ACB9QQ66_9MYRT|nr:hypothetical protein MLD38_016896 [Melastoma candidum]